MFKTIAVVLILCAFGFAQDAPVQELSASDAANAKQLYEAKQVADSAWDKFNAEMVNRYAMVPRDWTDASNTVNMDGFAYRKGFESGQIQFSKDFRFVVPTAPQRAYSTFGNCWTGAVPAVGTYTNDGALHVTN